MSKNQTQILNMEKEVCVFRGGGSLKLFVWGRLALELLHDSLTHKLTRTVFACQSQQAQTRPTLITTEEWYPCPPSNTMAPNDQTMDLFTGCWRPQTQVQFKWINKSQASKWNTKIWSASGINACIIK